MKLLSILDSHNILYIFYNTHCGLVTTMIRANRTYIIIAYIMAHFAIFYFGLKLANVDMNRKMLADLAVNDAEGFKTLADTAKKALAA